MSANAARPHVVEVQDMTNAEFLEAHAGPGRVGLCGGADAINQAIRKLQFAVTADGHRSPWSHAFVCSGRRVDGKHWVLESDLDVRHKQVRLGIQENRIDRYHDEAGFPNLAILDFGLDEAQANAVVTRALDLLAGLTTYSVTELLGTLLAMQNASLRKRRNLLERDGALFCSAMVQHCYAAAGIEFVPGVDRKHVSPHDIAACTHPHTAYVLVRDRGESSLRSLRESIGGLFGQVAG